ncbi:MAG: hydantoinase B/oxoprolinase family protein [Burkholderiales bacterium]|nr:hydantoinase B/oxoprolinase family protein [Burkholderiales bacterium]
MNAVPASIARSPDRDPITLEIIRHELVSIPEQIDRNITRTAFSPLINEYKDYAVGIVDPEGRLVSQSRGSLLIFVANALGTAVRDGIALHGAAAIEDGDVLISNHAGTLGQHLNNVVMYTPVRVGPERRLLGFFCVLMHWIDVGGSMVGSCTSTTTTEIWQEGIQFRNVRLFRRGERLADMFRMIECNTRFPEMLMGDVEAQIAGCFMGRDLVAAIADKYGAATYEAAVHAMWDGAEALARAAIGRARAGEYEAHAFLDNDGINLDRPVPIGIKVRVGGGRIAVDFSGVSEQLPGPLNAGRNGGAVAAARIAIKYMLSPDEPVNEGDFRLLDVEIPEGKFLSARPGAPIGGSGNMIPTVVDTVLRALAGAFPDRVAAAHHGTYGVHSFHGISPATGASFFHLDTLPGGWGGSAALDGYGPSRSNVHGDTSDVPVEMQEAFHPYRFESYALRPDSGGPGRHRGGVGVEKVYRITGPCRVNLKIERTGCPPWGLEGGGAGRTADVEIRRTDGSVQRVFKGDHALAPGDRVILRSGGGGGYGAPRQRDAALVARDVRAGLVSPQAALRDYGVAVRENGELDSEATARARAAQPGGEP